MEACVAATRCIDEDMGDETAFFKRFSVTYVHDVQSVWSRLSIHRAKFLLGPVGLTKMVCPETAEHSSKIIYLFHDVHSRVDTEEHCAEGMHITDFMRKIVTKTPYVADFILETYEHEIPFSELREEERTANYLMDLRSKFGECFQRNRREEKCPYKTPNVRYHFNDTRNNSNLAEQMRTLNIVLGAWNAGVRNDKERHYIANWPARAMDGWHDYFMEEFKVSKQLLRCHPVVEKTIRAWITTQLQATDNFGLADFNGFRQHVVDAGVSLAAPASHPFKSSRMPVVYMDAYTVARMFRSFVKRGAEYNGDMRNVFVYTGFVHSANYIELLQQLDCRVEKTTGDGWRERYPSHGVQCINVEAFTPWELLPTA